MKVTVAVNTQVISKEDYVQELRASGVGDVTRPLTVTTDTTPETIEVEVDNEQEFDSILNSNKVAGAQSDRLKLDHRVQGTRSITPNTTSTTDITHHNWGLAAMTQNSTTYASSFTYQDTGANVDCVIMDKESKEIANPYTGEKVLLTPEAIAVYDTIKGAEMMGKYDVMEKGIAWFQANYPKEYFVLLD